MKLTLPAEVGLATLAEFAFAAFYEGFIKKVMGAYEYTHRQCKGE